MNLTDRIGLLAKAIAADIKKLYNGTATIKVKSVASGSGAPALAFKELTLTYSTLNGYMTIPHGLSAAKIYSVQTSVSVGDGSYYMLRHCAWDSKNVILPVSNDMVFVSNSAKVLITYKA